MAKIRIVEDGSFEITVTPQGGSHETKRFTSNASKTRPIRIFPDKDSRYQAKVDGNWVWLDGSTDDEWLAYEVEEGA